VVGSAIVAAGEQAREKGADPVAAVMALVTDLAKGVRGARE
jgi:hypothetical protein